MRRIAVALGSGLALLAWPLAALEFSEVRHTPRVIDPGQGEVATVRFRTSEPAQVALHVYDGRDLRVRRVELGELPAGSHEARWDGRDDAGKPVPPEAYTYTLVASNGAGSAVRWDVADVTGGAADPPQDVAWDAETGRVSYRVEAASRVRIRIGLEGNGPLLNTLIDWVARPPGVHAEAWNGRDAAGVLDLSRHPRLEVLAEAFALPRNTILVGPPAGEVALVSLPADAPRRERTAKRPRRMYDYAGQSLGSRRDFPARLAPVGDVPRTAAGDPVVRGSLSLRLGVDDRDLALALNERCEAVFFVDGQYVFEREVGFLPMTWTWTPSPGTGGEHYITANIRSYEGHFGMTTLKVVVEPTAAP